MNRDRALVHIVLAYQNMLNNQAAYFRLMTRRPRRRWWVRPVNRRGNEHDFFNNVIREIYETDHEEFFRLFRMQPDQFRHLVRLVEPFLTKRSIRTPLPTTLRVAVTLMFLAHGDSAVSKHFEFRIGTSTVHKVINETCKAIWDALQPIFLKHPSKDEWKNISKRFEERWQFPNCLGAIDGRHMEIQCPPCTGTEYYNYKGFFSIVLLATCDADHKFTWIDIGQYDSISDGGVWSNTEFAQDLENGEADLPDPKPLPLTTAPPFPYVFVGDAAFPLSTFMMRPYPKKNLTAEQRIFNYRLSRARLTIENTFGILCAQWKILHKPLSMKVENAENLFKALVCLHNFVMSAEEAVPHGDRRYCGPRHLNVMEPDGSVTAGEWQLHQSQHFRQLGRVGANYAGSVPRGQREFLKMYFNSDVGEL